MVERRRQRFQALLAGRRRDVAGRKFVAGFRRNVGHFGQDAIDVHELAACGPRGHVVAHAPCGNLRRKRERHDLIDGDIFLRRRFVGEAGGVVGHLGFDGFPGVSRNLAGDPAGVNTGMPP